MVFIIQFVFIKELDLITVYETSFAAIYQINELLFPMFQFFMD